MLAAVISAGGIIFETVVVSSSFDVSLGTVGLMCWHTQATHEQRRSEELVRGQQNKFLNYVLKNSKVAYLFVCLLTSYRTKTCPICFPWKSHIPQKITEVYHF